MSKILLVVTEGRNSTEGFHWCLHTAKQSKGKVCVAYIAHDGEPENLGKTFLEEAEKQCRTFQAEFETSLHHGDYLVTVPKLVQEKNADILVITEKKLPFFKRLLAPTEASLIKNQITCELKTYN